MRNTNFDQYCGETHDVRAWSNIVTSALFILIGNRRQWIIYNSNWLTLIVSDCLTFTKLYPIISGTGTPVFDACI